MSNPNDYYKLFDDDDVLVGYGNEQARATWYGRERARAQPIVDKPIVDDVRLEPVPEQFYAIRMLDGDKTILGEYSWLMCDGPDDWEIANECDEGEFEIVLMTVTSVARRTLPLPCCAECGADTEHDGAVLMPHPTENEGLMICDECAELGGEAGGA